jgi:flavin-binding protein dodecin
LEKLLTFEQSRNECQTYGYLFEPGLARRSCGRRAAVQSELNQNQGELQMAQKVIDVVGTSKESFAKAAENAVAEAAKTVRGIAELEMELDGQKITQYRTMTKIYFDIEK